jgi:uncharacterized membrane protein
MMEDDQGNRSRFQRRASVFLWLNGVALFGIFWLIVGNNLGGRMTARAAYVSATVGYFVTLAFLWSVLGLPLSHAWLAEGAWSRLCQRRAKVQLGCELALLVICVPLVLAIVSYSITFVFVWCIFGLPVSAAWVAEDAWNRRSERRAKIQFGCAVTLLVICVPLIVFLYLCVVIKH